MVGAKGLVTTPEHMHIGRSHLGLAMEYYRQQRTEKTRGLRGGTIYVLVNASLTNVILQVVFLHRNLIKGYLGR